ncbi:MAG: branched-chain amino acid transport system II carrier protein [Clostridium fessum]
MTQTCLSHKQRLLVAGTLFGMFFGAGNLIFPVHLGQLAGRQFLPAAIGFILTAVGIPILGVAAIGGLHIRRDFRICPAASDTDIAISLPVCST